MLERDLTLSNGVIAKNLPKGFYWLRLGDTGGIARNKLGCDGFLWFKNHAWPTEVKVGNGRLTESEEKMKSWCKDRFITYLILRYHEKYSLWELELADMSLSYSGGNLGEVVENLIE